MLGICQRGALLEGNGDSLVGSEPHGQAGIEPLNNLFGHALLAQAERKPFAQALYAHRQGPAKAHQGQGMESLGKGHGNACLAQCPVQHGLQFQLRYPAGSVQLFMPDTQCLGPDDELWRRLGRRNLDFAHQKPPVFIACRLVGNLVPLWQDKPVADGLLVAAAHKAAFQPAAVTGAAVAAGMVAAVLCSPALEGLFPFPEQEFGTDAALDMRPGKHLIDGASLDTLLRVKAMFFQGLKPGLKGKMLHPAGEDGAFAVGTFDDAGHISSGSGQNALKMADPWFVPAQGQAAYLLEFSENNVYAPVDFIQIDLVFPLEGRIRLGHKGRDGCRHAELGTAASACLAHLAAKIHYGQQVFRRFRRQPYHEIQLDLAPAVLNELLDMGDKLLFGDALVDNVAQPLGSCFRCQGDACAPYLGHALHDAVVNGSHAQGGQGERDLLSGALVKHCA